MTARRFVVEKYGARWHLSETLDVHPFTSFVGKFPTKRSAKAVADIGRADTATREQVSLVLADLHRDALRKGFVDDDAATACRHGASAAQHAAELLVLLMGRLGLDQVEPTRSVCREFLTEHQAGVVAWEHAPLPGVPDEVDAARETIEHYAKLDPRKVVALNLADTRERGEVAVLEATADAFDSGIMWENVEGVVTWRAWVSDFLPLADRARWDSLTASPESVSANRRTLTYAWALACNKAVLSPVLDLRGAPHDDAPGGLLVEGWRFGLERAIRRADKGVVLLVDQYAWALARCLPSYAGKKDR